MVKKRKGLFDDVVRSIRTGSVCCNGAEYVVDGGVYNLHFVYSPKARDVSISLNGADSSKPGLAQRVKDVLGRITPSRTSVEVTKQSGYNNKQTEQFTGLRALRLGVLCRLYRVVRV